MIVRDQPVIAGRGGKSGGSGATESRDTLRSTQIAEIMDVISEGECEGLVDGLKSIYLDGVPIQNADGSNNFTGVDIAWQLGTQGQAALPGFDGVKTEFSVGVDVTHAAPVVRTITNPNFDRARVTIAVPQLSSQDTTTGNLSGSSFSWTIEVQSDGGGYVLVHDGALVGKAMSEDTRTVEFDLPGDAPWDIRVSRTSPDSTSSAVVNAFGWSSYTAIQSVKLRYPNTAYTLTRIDAEQFNSVAARSFHWRGLRIRVPTNYDPVTRAYSGTWDGTFKVAYTNNPAWVYFDMATSDRYGLGAFLDESQINKWSLYAIAQYCDALVPDGLGGMEPRFTCNVQIMDRQDAFKTMQQLAEVFRGMAYWAGETLDCFQDSPEEASLLYSPANVVDGNFSYQDSSERGLHSVFICYWTDMAQMGKSVPEAYAPSELIDRYGMRELEMKPLGCTSRGMAARVARWARYTEQMEGESVSFVVGSDGAVAAPGKIFKVADPNVAGERQGGRIIDATLTQVHLDAPVNLAVGETYTISVLQPAGTDHMGYVVEERTVTNVANPAASLINVTPAFSAVPVAGTVWMLQSAGIEPTLWRCLSVEEKQGKNQYQITGVAHNPSKFDAIELGMVLDEPIISRLSADSLPPQNLSLLEVVYTDKTINKTSLTISIVSSATGKRHKFSYRQDNGWWVDLPETSEQTVTLQSIDAGLYDVSVRSYNALGVLSAAISDSITLIGGKAGVRAVSLKSNAITFKVNNSGVSSPAAITLTANVGSLDEDLLEWEVVTGTATLTGTGLSRTLAYADAGTDTVTIRASIEQDGETYADTMTLSKVFNGEQGVPGVSGTKYALVSLYQWAPTQPGAPSGQSTFTWATATQSAYTGGNSWVIGMPANPGSAGLRLWAVTLQIAAPGGEAATTVFWSSAAAITAVGLNGAGTQSVEVGIFAWAANLASLPSLAGTATYTWSTQAVSAVPSGWSLTAGTSTSAGLTLFKASVRLQDVTTSASTAIDWSLASISAVGYAGSSGSQGASARIAYAKVTGATIGAGTVTTAGSSSFPPVNSWGRGETWSGTVPAVAADESVMQTNGIYDPATGQTVWGSPYLAVWRVGSLSAITANLGSINAGEMDIGGKFQVSSSGYLVAKGIQIQDEFGNVILSTRTGAASSVPSSYVTPAAGWLNSNIGVSGGVLTGIGTAGVQVDNSFIAAGANLCPNADFGAGTTSWGIFANSFGGQWAVNALTGTEWLLDRGASEGTLALWQQNGTTSGYFEVCSDPIPVVAGRRYIVSGYSGAHRCKTDVFVYWCDSFGTAIANSGADADYNDEAASGGVSLSGYKRHQQAGTAPAGTVTARVVIRKFATKPGNADSWGFFCRMMLEEAAANANSAGPWSPPGAGKWAQTRINTAATTANWAGVSGSGKPADNATADLVLVNNGGMTIAGNAITKTGGTNGSWDASVVSKDGYAGGAFVSFVPNSATGYFMIGLNSDKDTDNSYASLDFEWYCRGDGSLQARRQGDVSEWDGAYAAGDVLALTYDGTKISWLKNGAVMATYTVAISVPLFLDSSFYTLSAGANGVRFGPLSSNAWAAIGGAGKPQDSANQTYVDGSGNIQGVSSGAGTTVNNGFIGINSSGQFYGGGAGTGVVVSNAQMSIGADGKLYSAGSYLGSQVTLGGLGAGAFATLNSITSVNVSTYIASAAIDYTRIGVLQASNLSVVALSNTINGGVTSTGRVEVTSNRIDVFDDSNVRRVRIGLL